jgi:hypothetical protein
MAKMHSITIKNRAVGLVFALGLVGVGALVLFLGFALLATFVVAGAVLGTGVAAYRWLRGGSSRELTPHRDMALDPALEVHPSVRNLVPPPGGAAADDERIPPPA